MFSKIVEFFNSAQKQGFLRGDIEIRETVGIFVGSLHQLMRMDPINQKFFGNSLKDTSYRKRILDNFIKLVTIGIKEAPSS